jgi:hypothetical protein
VFFFAIFVVNFHLSGIIVAPTYIMTSGCRDSGANSLTDLREADKNCSPNNNLTLDEFNMATWQHGSMDG